MPEIIDFIEVLVAKDFAYVSNNDVFFRVKKFAAVRHASSAYH